MRSPSLVSRFAGCVLGVILLAGPAVRAAPQPVTRVEAETFAEAFTAAVVGGDGAAVSKLVDGVTLIDTALSGLGAPAEFRQGALSAVDGFSGALTTAITGGATYELVRVRQVGADFRPLLRLAGDSGLNYHELHLARTSTGEIKAIDLDIYVSGEPLTQTLRRLSIPAIASLNQGVVSKLIHGEGELVTHAKELTQFNQQVQAKQYDKAEATYQAFPPGLKAEKSLMLVHTMNLAHSGEDAYAQAIHEYEKKFPNDPSILLVSIDGYFLEGKFDETLKAIEVLDKRLGGDPYLDVIRATMESQLKHPAKALALMQKFVKFEPKNKTGWAALIAMTLEQKDFANVARWLNESHRQAGLEWSDVRTSPEFAGFVNSPEGKKWVAAHPSTQPAAPPAKPDSN